MKSLKRTLSLVLALVMVLGLFGGISMTATASDFKDDEKIQYNEAVDVMSGIGAINGFEDGNFKPTDKITRAEAATMITRAVIGKSAASKLTGLTSSFTDVDEKKFDWAVPSIEYLYSEGIIDGVGGGKFEPNGEVTGYEVGKMLLCALGYGANKEYTGKSWEVSVAKDAARYGIMAGRADDANSPSKPASREEVALYCLNTIQAQTVTFISTLNYYAKNTYKNGANDEPETINHTVYPDLTLSKAYDGGGTNNGKDDFGNPAKVWTYKGDTVGKYPVKAALTYTTAQDADALETAMENFKVAAGGTNVLVKQNGKNGSVDAGNGATISTIASNLAPLTGNGITLSVYLNESGTISAVTQTQTLVAKVGAANPVNGTITLTVTTTPLTGAPGGGSWDATFPIDKDHDLYSTVSAMSEGDRVVVTPLRNAGDSVWNVAAVAPTTKLTGVVTGVKDGTTDDANVYTISGETYGVAKSRTFDEITPNAKTERYIWTDANGYIVDYEDVAVTTDSNIVYVTEFYEGVSKDGKVVNMASYVNAAGEVSSVTYDGTAKTPASDNNKPWKLTLNATTGKYKFDEVDSPITAVNAKDGESVSLAVNITIASDAKKLSDTASLTVKGSDETAINVGNYYSPKVKFIVIDAKTGEAEVREGVQASKTGATAKTCWAVVEAYSTTDKTPAVTAVYLYGGSFTGEDTQVDTSQIVYLNSTTAIGTTTVVDSADRNKTFNIYDVYINGVQKKDGLVVDTIENSGTAGHFYFMKSSATYEGVCDLVEFSDPTQAVKVEEVQDATAGLGSVITVNGKSIDIANATIVDVRSATDQDAKPLTGLTGAALGEAIRTVYQDVEVSVVYNDKDKTGVIVYVSDAGAAWKKVTLDKTSFTSNELTFGVSFAPVYVDGSSNDVVVTITQPTAAELAAATKSKNVTLEIQQTDGTKVGITEVDAQTGFAIASNTLTIKMKESTGNIDGAGAYTFKFKPTDSTGYDLKVVVTEVG